MCVVYFWIWEHIFWPRNTSHCPIAPVCSTQPGYIFFKYSYLPNTPNVHMQSKHLSSKGLLAKQCHGRVVFVCIILWHHNARSRHKRSQKLYSVSKLVYLSHNRKLKNIMWWCLPDPDHIFWRIKRKDIVYIMFSTLHIYSLILPFWRCSYFHHHPNLGPLYLPDF